MKLAFFEGATDNRKGLVAHTANIATHFYGTRIEHLGDVVDLQTGDDHAALVFLHACQQAVEKIDTPGFEIGSVRHVVDVPHAILIRKANGNGCPMLEILRLSGGGFDQVAPYEIEMTTQCTNWVRK